MNDELAKYDHFIPLISEKIRVIKLELIGESNVAGFWSYKIIYVKDSEVSEDHVIGKDMSDALYRFSRIIETPFIRFPLFLKN